MEFTVQQRANLHKFIEAIVFGVLGIAFWRYGPTWRLPRSIHYSLVVVTPIAGFILYRMIVHLVTQQREAPLARPWKSNAEPFSRNKQYQFPKRFGLTTLAVATTWIAMMAGFLLTIGVDPTFAATILAFVCFVTIVQAVVDRAPRSVSIVAGAIFCPTLLMLYGRNILGATDFANGFVTFTFGGALLGYLTGGIVAGMFLTTDVIKAWWNESSTEPVPADQTSPWE